MTELDLFKGDIESTYILNRKMNNIEFLYTELENQHEMRKF